MVTLSYKWLGMVTVAIEKHFSLNESDQQFIVP